MDTFNKHWKKMSKGVWTPTSLSPSDESEARLRARIDYQTNVSEPNFSFDILARQIANEFGCTYERAMSIVESETKNLQSYRKLKGHDTITGKSMEKGSVSLSDLPKLKQAYAEAVRSNADKFNFKGDEILVAYAKYLIEYMEGLGKTMKKRISYGILALMQQYAENFHGSHIDELIMELQSKYPMIDEEDIISVAEREGERRGYSDYGDSWKSIPSTKKSFHDVWKGMQKGHKDFDIKWHSTDAWRGYEEAVPKKNTNWFEVHADWTTGDWEDAGEHAASKQQTKIQQFRDKISQAGGTTKFLHLPTSNVFSSSLQVFARGVEESVAQDLARNIFG